MNLLSSTPVSFANYRDAPSVAWPGELKMKRLYAAAAALHDRWNRFIEYLVETA